VCLAARGAKKQEDRSPRAGQGPDGAGRWIPSNQQAHVQREAAAAGTRGDHGVRGRRRGRTGGGGDADRTRVAPGGDVTQKEEGLRQQASKG